MITEKTDNEVIQSFLAGDESSYVELVSRYKDKAFNLAVRLTRNADDAEEVIQDVFVTVYRKLANFEGKSAFSSWLYRITVNTALMLIRKRKQHPTVSMEDITLQVRENWTGNDSASTDVTYMSTGYQLREKLEVAIGRLPEEYRTIFLLRDVDGLSNEDVSEVLGMSVPAVKSRLHRARLMLRKRLQKFYNDFLRNDTIAYGPTMASHMRAEACRMAA